MERTDLMDVLWMASKSVGILRPDSVHVEESHPDLGSTLNMSLDELLAEKGSIELAVERVQVFREV